MRYIITLLGFILFCSCNVPTTETEHENTSPSEEVVEIEVPTANEETDKPEVLENDNYPEDWEKIKTAILSNDESEVGIHCAIAGVDEKELIEAVNQVYVIESFKNSKFSDLIPDQKGNRTYLKFYIENPSNSKENLSIFINQGPHLFIEYFINMK